MLTQADVHHQTACNTVGSLKDIVDSVTELEDLAKKGISTLEDVFYTTTLKRTFPTIVNDKQNRSFQQSLCVTQTTEQKPPLPEDCASIYKQQQNRISGVYKIQPRFLNQSISVYCDMETSGGGWTAVTSQDNMVLRVDLEDFEGSRRYAEHDEFLVRSERELYKMSYKTYKGDVGKSLVSHNNMTFSTKNKDNDKNSGSCAQSYKGGWWYNSCRRSNLNGLYYTEDKVDTTSVT
ncbi:techylectin-5B-like [Tachypleus tridentatus]|uniref:techylectin-5B-like n=1 Tax=Tachypleus tridentatus TaxID=6853 RepID=UPI003FD45570